MATVTSLVVRHYKINLIVVGYQVLLDDGDSTSDYTLELHRSENPDGNFQLVNSLSWNQNSYYDAAVDTRSKNRRYYYVIKVVDVETNEVQESSAITISPTPDLIALDIMRRERLLLRWYIKTKCYFLLARTFGTYCNECYDTTKRRNVKSKCTTCHGTGFEGGFFDPIPGYIDISPHPLIQQVTNFGPVQPIATNAWTTNYPLLKINDYIVEIDTGLRWRVHQIGYNEKTRFVTKQILGLSQESRGSIIYNIEMPYLYVEPY